MRLLGRLDSAAPIRSKHRYLAFAPRFLERLISVFGPMQACQQVPFRLDHVLHAFENRPRPARRLVHSHRIIHSSKRLTERIAAGLQLPQHFDFFCQFHPDQTFMPNQLFWFRATIRVKCEG
jgi:hypothetical protein